MILVYPVVTMGEKTHGGSRKNLLGKDPEAKLVELFSNEKQVTPNTPPAFLAHAKDDGPVVPENSKAFFAALQKHKVKAKYLELPSGGHGLNGYKGEMWDRWQTQSLAWLAEHEIHPRDSGQGKVSRSSRREIKAGKEQHTGFRAFCVNIAIGHKPG